MDLWELEHPATRAGWQPSMLRGSESLELSRRFGRYSAPRTESQPNAPSVLKVEGFFLHMSVKIMSLVWEHAPYSEGSLLVLLALADWADDNGIAWPSVPALAKKARLKPRRTQYVIRKLQSDGFVDIEDGGGRNKQHRYSLNLDKLKGAINAPYIEKPSEINSAINAPFTGKGALSDIKRVHFGAQRVHSATQTLHSSAPDPLEDPLEDPPIEPSEPVLPFSSKEFTQAIGDFLQNRKENKVKPYTRTGLRTLYRNLGEWGESAAIEALEDSVRGNWKGVFRPKAAESRQRAADNHKPEVELDPFGEPFIRKPFTAEDAIFYCPDKDPDDIRAHFAGQLEWTEVRSSR